jgi:hypothetical protein
MKIYGRVIVVVAMMVALLVAAPVITAAPRQVARSSAQKSHDDLEKLYPVHRGFIAMSGWEAQIQGIGNRSPNRVRDFPFCRKMRAKGFSA